MVDYGKLDTGLAIALDEVGDERAPRLPVFVHVDAGDPEARRDALADLGVAGPLQGGIATATLSADQVRRLSERPWVLQLRLGTPLELLE